MQSSETLPKGLHRQTAGTLCVDQTLKQIHLLDELLHLGQQFRSRYGFPLPAGILSSEKKSIRILEHLQPWVSSRTIHYVDRQMHTLGSA